MQPSPDWPDRVRGDPSRRSKQEKAEDEYLRQLVRAARSVCDPLSVFLGGSVVTVYEHNAGGQVVRSTCRPWVAELDRECLLALIAWEADLCPGCRQPLEETTKAEHEDRYVSSPPIRCHRCTASEQAAERYQQQPQSSALLIPVALRDPI